jgi:serine protease AprX
MINGAAFTVKGSSLAALAKDSNVAYISPDRTVWATATVTEHYDQAVLAPYAWSKNLTGSGIGVAVIDSGITAGRDFTLANGTGSRIVYNQNFAGGQITVADLYGHGTHVAGVLAGNGMNSRGANFRKTFIGIADNASLINLRVLDQNGAGRDSAVIAAIENAISLKSRYNIRVILSLGRAVYESYKLDPLCQAVEAAWKAGIVVVVAAGNEGRNDSAHTDGYGTIAAPGNDPYVITVGAMKPMGTPTRADDLIASYSSKGPTLLDHIVKPDIVAPGNLMTSVLASSSATLVKTSPKNIVALSSYTANGKGNTWCGISGHPSGTVEHGSAAFDSWDCEVPGRNARQEWEHLPGEWLFSALGWLDHVGTSVVWGTSVLGGRARGESRSCGDLRLRGARTVTTATGCSGERRWCGVHRTKTKPFRSS